MSQENNSSLSEEEINGYIKELDELFQSLIPLLAEILSPNQNIKPNNQP